MDTNIFARNLDMFLSIFIGWVWFLNKTYTKYWKLSIFGELQILKMINNNYYFLHFYAAWWKRYCTNFYITVAFTKMYYIVLNYNNMIWIQFTEESFNYFYQVFKYFLKFNIRKCKIDLGELFTARAEGGTFSFCLHTSMRTRMRNGAPSMSIAIFLS